MKTARLPNGELILADKYNKEANGEGLLCADGRCPAHMHHRREGLTHGAAHIRTASFVSDAVKDHLKDCTAHEDFRVLARGKKSIEQGLAEGKLIVINLNLGLTANFNNVSRAPMCKPSALVRKSYVTASAKSVENVLDYMKEIETKGGKEGLSRTLVNYQGTTMPVAEFVIDTRDKYRDLLNKMYRALETAVPSPQLKDFPRLIHFRATQKSRDAEEGPVKGTPITFAKDHGNRLVLLQRADAPPEYARALRDEKLDIVAIPSLDYLEANTVLEKLKSWNQRDVYLDMHWKIVGAHQLTPTEEPPAPPSPQGLLFKP